MRRWLAYTGILIITLLGLSLFAVLIGRQARAFSTRITALSLDQPACRLPCWAGIIPGKTTFEQAKQGLPDTFAAQSAYSAHFISESDKHLRFQLESESGIVEVLCRVDQEIVTWCAVDFTRLQRAVRPNLADLITLLDRQEANPTPVRVRFGGGTNVFFLMYSSLELPHQEISILIDGQNFPRRNRRIEPHQPIDAIFFHKAYSMFNNPRAVIKPWQGFIRLNTYSRRG